MALTYTPPAELGAKCPNFDLLGVDNQRYSLNSFAQGRVFVVMFICNHCPYVKAVEDRLLNLARRLQPKGVEFVAICSNDATDYPEDSFDNLRTRWLTRNYPFIYLYDETQDVAKRFGAVCTPDFFVYDEKRQLTYRGRLDDSWKDPALVKNEELKTAIEQTLKGERLSAEQAPSMGCSIKWKK